MQAVNLPTLMRHNSSLSLQDIDKMSAAMAEIFQSSLANCDSIAIPGFGTFETVKRDEYIATDSLTGKRTLMPPAIDLSFTPGSKLRKSIQNI